jgi:hypothetical protein
MRVAFFHFFSFFRFFGLLYRFSKISPMRNHLLDTRSPGAPGSKNVYYCITCVIFSSNKGRIVHLRGGGGSLCQLVSAGQGPKGGMFSSTRETNTSKKTTGCRNNSMLCSVKAFLSCVVGLLGCFFHLCDFLGLAAFLRVFDSRLPLHPFFPT